MFAAIQSHETLEPWETCCSETVFVSVGEHQDDASIFCYVKIKASSH